jgi:uncharacterized protein YgiM (DUF1202 family)
MYDWSKIKKVYRFGYLLVIVNIALGYGLYATKHTPRTITNDDFPKGTIIAKRGVKLRAQPNIQSTSKLSIGNGEEVSIINDTSTVSRGWVKVSYNGVAGWVWGEFITR